LEGVGRLIMWSLIYCTYISTNVIKINNFRKMRWARDADLSLFISLSLSLTHTQKDEKVIQCKLLIRKLKRKDQFLRTCVSCRIFIRILTQEDRGASTGLIWLRTGASGRIF
jgi:hypothetical protein